jgi:mRNA interferase MazF
VARALARADVWTVSGGADYAGKPRPAAIIQDDRFDTDSVTVCPLTTDPTDAPLFRLAVEPSSENGLREASSLMIDKITTIPRSKLGARVGSLAGTDVVRLNRAIVVFLGVASAG